MDHFPACSGPVAVTTTGAAASRHPDRVACRFICKHLAACLEFHSALALALGDRAASTRWARAADEGHGMALRSKAKPSLIS